MPCPGTVIQPLLRARRPRHFQDIMQIPRFLRAVPFPLALLLAAACADKPASAASSAAGDTVSHGVQASVVAAADTDTVAARVTRDSLRLAADSIKLAAESAAVRSDSASPARKAKVPEDSIRWPTDRPAPLPGALLPSHRIVAFYGNPLSKRMGILGELPPDQMLAKLERTAKEWAAADSTTTVKPARHLIVTVAQASPGRDG